MPVVVLLRRGRYLFSARVLEDTDLLEDTRTLQEYVRDLTVAIGLSCLLSVLQHSSSMDERDAVGELVTPQCVRMCVCVCVCGCNRYLGAVPGVTVMANQFYLGPGQSGAPAHYHQIAVNALAWGEKHWIVAPAKYAARSDVSAAAGLQVD